MELPKWVSICLPDVEAFYIYRSFVLQSQQMLILNSSKFVILFLLALKNMNIRIQLKFFIGYNHW